MGFVFSTIVIAAVAGLVVYFTAFKKAVAADSPITGVSSESASASSGSQQPPRTGASLVDHLSHSVPGYEYHQVDYDGDGFELIQLDGSRSHTHYYDAGPPITVGKLIEMTWFNNATRASLASGARPQVSFPVGTTVVGLTVADNYRDTHTDYATVIVEAPVIPGTYCYYYDRSSDGLSISNTLDDGLRPIFAAASSSISFTDDSKFPPSRRGKEFQMRCVFTVSGGSNVLFSLDHFGPVRLLVSNKVVFESSSADEETTSGSIELPPGQHSAQLLYSRKNSAAGKLHLTAGGDDIVYDRSSVLPVLTSIDPSSSTLDGGGSAKIVGIGLLNRVTINFGDKSLSINKEESTETEVFVTVPQMPTESIVPVTAKNKAGTSNAIQFLFSKSGKQPIKFKETRVMKGSSPLEIPVLTGIKYGPDHKYYATAMNARVHTFSIDSSMQLSDHCLSNNLGQHMSILGLAFNPADTELKIYVSSSILDWRLKNKISSPDGWANGEILIIRRSDGPYCLIRDEKPIISGLPVSNHDHGVNGLEFDNDGKLHIQVGGFTNAGVNDARGRLGGIEENPLSAASLIADVNRPGFNGMITYSSNDPALAVQKSGDVYVFSPGWRNSFGIVIHSNGYLYATDNGASIGFGDKSVTCSSHEALAGKKLDDKLGKVIKGKYFGHPNRNRGRKDKRQCVFKGLEESSDDYYQAPIATFESSTDGVMEYTANTFGGQLKGDIICSKYSTDESPGKLFKVQLDEKGDLKSGPDELWPASGLSVTMSPWGDILMPRVFKREIMVLTPVTRMGLVASFVSVMPHRGPMGGGNIVLVTGYNLGDGAVATFDGKRCTEATAVSSNRQSFKCKVPPGTRGKGVRVGLEFSNSALNVAPGSGVDYRYMNI